MTPAQADQRILKSERILTGWGELSNDDMLLVSPHSYSRMAEDEIEVMTAIVVKFPDKGERIEKLIDGWIRFIAAMERRVN